MWCDIGIGIAILEKIIALYPVLTTLPPTAIEMEPKALDPILQMDRLVFRPFDFLFTDPACMLDPSFFCVWFCCHRPTATANLSAP